MDQRTTCNVNCAPCCSWWIHRELNFLGSNDPEIHCKLEVNSYELDFQSEWVPVRLLWETWTPAANGCSYGHSPNFTKNYSSWFNRLVQLKRDRSGLVPHRSHRSSVKHKSTTAHFYNTNTTWSKNCARHLPLWHHVCFVGEVGLVGSCLSFRLRNSDLTVPLSFSMLEGRFISEDSEMEQKLFSLLALFSAPSAASNSRVTWKSGCLL